jgi:hypothetical protein
VTATTVPAATSYTPQAAQSSNATTVGTTPNPFAVTPNQTVSGQISNIIASGSPLMQQAEANANEQMNQRGLINSSQAITAGQNALYTAAEPIAAADANTYATAATNTTTAQNAALAAEAAAKNTASATNAQLETQNSQFNAGAANTAAAASAAASNTFTGNLQSILGSTNVAEIQTASSEAIANIQANTSLSVADKNNAMSEVLANIQANTSLSVEQQQTASAQVVAAMDNANALAVANTNNAAAMANIQANGVINEAVTNLTDTNKTLLQTSASASSIYTQALTNMSSILTNPNLDTAQQTQALNDQVTSLQDALQAIQGIANDNQVTSNLDFSSGGAADTGAGSAPAPAAPAAATPAAANDTGNGFTGTAADLGLINNGGPA